VTRKQFLLGIVLTLAGEKVMQADKGQLTVDLGQWKQVVIKLGNKSKTITVEDLFKEL